MLQQTVEQKQELVNKINVLDFAIRQLKASDVKKEDKEGVNNIEQKILAASTHKIKLLEELLRVCNVKDLEPVELEIKK